MTGQSRRGWRVRRSGNATAGPGGFANTGVINGYRPVPRSAYLRQVEQIFPYQLVGREAELGQLAVFCTAPDDPGRGGYVWWQGQAWAGKSALMAWFVQHPPAGVRVLSFFITARLASQSDRGAFLEVVLEQLAEIAGQPLPDPLPAATRQSWFGQLLADAAASCSQDGQRLVLVVDGLDEDQGVTGPGAHSIAALLPAIPPAGVRVIVAGRPNPPVPADVPARHPLRDPAIVRKLSVSEHAAIIRQDAERELTHLLHEDGLGRRVLGLVTVARGGLSSRDLAELTGHAPLTVDQALESVLGRTFRGRPNRWQTSAPPVYLLAHEQLQQTADNSLTPAERTTLLEQLHHWATGYRRRGWPPGTPEYLLRGYHRLLLATGDTQRMGTLATDRGRLDRMLDLSGGDAAALAEITAAADYISRQDDPDLTAMLSVAYTREHLVQRNEKIPTELPAVWARVGNPARAEALARSVADFCWQAEALAAVARVLAEHGHIDRARQIAGQAEAAARSTTFPERQDEALAAVAEATARAGDPDHAETLARTLTDPAWQARALAAIARVLAEHGDTNRAEHIARQAETTARTIDSLYRQDEALAAVAEATARAGDPDHAETLARTLTDPAWQARALAAIARVLAEHGDTNRAEHIARQAETTARTIDSLYRQDEALAAVAEATARAGDPDHAETLARTLTSPAWQARALAAIAEAEARAGDPDHAEALARTLTDPAWQARALAAIARVLAEHGDTNRAEHIARQAETTARAITDPAEQDEALVAVAEATAQAGEFDRAEALARTLTNSHRPDWALAAIAEAEARAGEFHRAEALARTLTNPRWQDSALAAIAEAEARAGEFHRAEALAGTLTNLEFPDSVLVAVAAAEAQAGDPDRAEAFARTLTGPTWQARALAAVANVLARRGGAAQVMGWSAISGTSMTGHLRDITDTDQLAGAGCSVIPLADICSTSGRMTQKAAGKRSRHLIALALTLADDYTELLPVIAAVEPAAVLNLTDLMSLGT